NDALGGNDSADMLLASVNFGNVDRWVQVGDWDALRTYLVQKATALAAAGAAFLAIGSNTGHIAADAISQTVDLPLLHVGDAVAEEAITRGARTVGLLGNRVVTELPFYRAKLESRGLDVLTPSSADRDFAHRIVFDELSHGVFTEQSRNELIRIMRSLWAGGADIIILGCTEYGLLVTDTDAPDIPRLDTNAVYIEAVAKAILD
ncbi:MAG: amino acid racemase, partial [Corynebacterium variabile]|nr:amino acid racemase [Corynebacterium variabile]